MYHKLNFEIHMVKHATSWIIYFKYFFFFVKKFNF
jgi:hypothetical protein